MKFEVKMQGLMIIETLLVLFGKDMLRFWVQED
jgi:hypothetical protein